jgi:hypothetical protein
MQGMAVYFGAFRHCVASIAPCRKGSYENISKRNLVAGDTHAVVRRKSCGAVQLRPEIAG